MTPGCPVAESTRPRRRECGAGGRVITTVDDGCRKDDETAKASKALLAVRSSKFAPRFLQIATRGSANADW